MHRRSVALVAVAALTLLAPTAQAANCTTPIEKASVACQKQPPKLAPAKPSGGAVAKPVVKPNGGSGIIHQDGAGIVGHGSATFR